MLSIKTRVVLAGAASLLILNACNSKQNTAAPASKDETVATVNGTAISKSRIDMIVKQGAAGHGDSPEARKAITEQLVMQTLVAEEAVKKGLDKSPEVLEQLDVLKQSVLANAYVQDYIKNHKVSDGDLKAEYDRIKAGISGTEYKARHILVATEAEANDIIAKLKKDPGAFEQLAMEKSLDTGSKARGGDLGWFDLNKMVPEFGDAVAKLEKGKISETPVKTQYGYHVILLEDSKPIEAPPFEEVKSGLAEQLQQKNLKKELDDLKAKAKIEIAGAPAAASAPTK
ncbi:MAG TPA: peptidylprolyl isomerase [Methylophilaceae bacterium]|nr:peptidylprolyl isomerase [Methylophilaceae bacterium]HQR60260.1 peptidylprolyl isomerase [Methylophilaceae bacterium]